MKGKELKGWVLEKAKSLKHPKTGDSGEIKGPDAGTMAEARAEKAEFPVKGTMFRINERYSYERTLGLGAYGVVCAARDKTEDRKVAIKKVGALFDDLTDAKRILREIRLISSMKHENVLCIVDIDEPENYAKFNEIYLVTELMDTDLNKLIRSRHKLLEAQQRFFTYQILRALKYIHRYGHSSVFSTIVRFAHRI